MTSRDPKVKLDTGLIHINFPIFIKTINTDQQSEAAMKSILAIPLLLLSLTAFIAITPAYAAPVCTATATEGSNTYTLTLSPCAPSGEPLNTLVTATASSSDVSIVRVDFVVTNPAASTTTTPVTPAPFTDSFTTNLAGTWNVHAVFCNSAGACIDSPNDVISFTVQILVLNAVPLGVASVLAISLLGLVAFTRTRKRPLTISS